MTASDRARPIGTLGGALGTAAGAVQLTWGSTIPAWTGNKADPARLGLVTILLGLIALGAARYSPADPAPVGAALRAATLAFPALVGFTTVGRMWYLPGALLLVAAALAATGVHGSGRQVAAALGASWARLLTGTLALLAVALGLTAHGPARVAGALGGVIALALAVTSSGRSWIGRRGPGLALVPFACLTWWSVVTPLLALLALAIGVPGHDRTTARHSQPGDRHPAVAVALCVRRAPPRGCAERKVGRSSGIGRATEGRGRRRRRWGRW